jgi:hypothetical protein
MAAAKGGATFRHKIGLKTKCLADATSPGIGIVQRKHVPGRIWPRIFQHRRQVGEMTPYGPAGTALRHQIAFEVERWWKNPSPLDHRRTRRAHHGGRHPSATAAKAFFINLANGIVDGGHGSTCTIQADTDNSTWP